MAKKTNGLKIVGIALLAIVGFGSLSALARNKDKDEDKHVHDFSETNICADCGERQEEILLSDVKVGMDLSGYAMRYTVDWEEFSSHLNFENYLLNSQGETVAQCSIQLQNNYSISFEETMVFVSGAGGALLEWQDGEDAFYYEQYPLDNGSIITEISLDFDNYPLELFEFYYVGLDEMPAAVSYSMRAETQASESVFDEILVKEGSKTCGEWSPLY